MAEPRKASKSKRKSQAVEAKRGLYRQLILEGAQRAFAEKGYDDAKMEDIAGESGLAMGTVYSVFPGKAKIFAAIGEAAGEELFRRALGCIEPGMTARAATLASITATVRYFLEHPDYLRMELNEGLAWGSETEARGRERTRAHGDGLELLKAAFARCVDDGSFVAGEPELMARLAIATMQLHLGHWLRGGMVRPHDDVVAEVLAQVERSFAPDAARAMETRGDAA